MDMARDCPAHSTTSYRNNRQLDLTECLHLKEIKHNELVPIRNSEEDEH